MIARKVRASLKGLLRLFVNRSASHSITLANQTIIDADIVQIAERGLILITRPEGRVLFLPNDQYLRVDKRPR